MSLEGRTHRLKSIMRSLKRDPVAVKRKRKLRVLDKFKWKCAQCGENRRNLLTVDHIIPISKGGTSHMSNLQCLCKRCNGTKSDTVPDNHPVADAWKHLNYGNRNEARP